MTTWMSSRGPQIFAWSLVGKAYSLNPWSLWMDSGWAAPARLITIRMEVTHAVKAQITFFHRGLSAQAQPAIMTKPLRMLKTHQSWAIWPHPGKLSRRSTMTWLWTHWSGTVIAMAFSITNQKHSLKVNWLRQAVSYSAGTRNNSKAYCRDLKAQAVIKCCSQPCTKMAPIGSTTRNHSTIKRVTSMRISVTLSKYGR